MTEDWRVMDGFDGCYKISSIGQVLGVNNQLRRPQLEQGYLKLRLGKGKQRKNYRVHRLVAIAFIPNPLNKRCVNHINSITTDNRVENLEWATHRENNLHSIIKGRHPKGVAVEAFNDNEVLYFETIKAAASIGYTQQCIYRAIYQYKGRKRHRGYFWRYANKREAI